MARNGSIDSGTAAARNDSNTDELDTLDARALTRILSETDEVLQDLAATGEIDWDSEAHVDTEVVETLTGDGDDPTIDDLMDSLAATTMQFEGFPDRDLSGTLVPEAQEETAELLAPDLLFPKGRDDD